MDSQTIVNVLLAKRKEKGALTVQEQAQLEKAVNTLSDNVSWQAWDGACLVGEGQTESEAINDAMMEFARNKKMGIYPDDMTEDVFRKGLDVGVCGEDE